MVAPLCIIFNALITQGKFPEKMKLADVVPLFKNKSTYEPTNYRPILLLLTVSKLLEKIIYTRTYNFLTKTNQIFVSQYGFRSNHSCKNTISELVGNILKGKESGEHTACVFLDLSKAFNNLKYEVLLRKLDRYGIQGLANAWFKDYLNNRKLRVKCTVEFSGKMEYSEEYSVNYGALQGSCLGSLIFLIFNNDLAMNLCNCNSILFADDTTIYKNNKSILKLKNDIENDFKQILDWFKANKLTFNIEKTKFMLFKVNNSNQDFDLQINNITIKKSPVCKFLGVLIDENLTWNHHDNDRLLKIKRNTHLLRTSNNIFDPNTKKLIYYGHIHSHMIYCLLIWGNSSSKCNLARLQKAQNKCVRLINNKLELESIYKNTIY